MPGLASTLTVLLAAIVVGAPANARPVTLVQRDAGPTAGPALELDALPVEPAAAPLCQAEQAALGCDPADTETCSCAVRVFYTAPIAASSGPTEVRQLALIDARSTAIPGPTQALGIAVRTDAGGRRTVAALGGGEVGGMGTHAMVATTLHGFGHVSTARGGWAWVDVMTTAAAPDDGTAWTRTLWLCGGEGAARCAAVPLKSWWSPKVDGYSLDPANPPRANGPRYALAIAIDSAGVLTARARTRVPKPLAALLGRHRLDEVAALLAPVQ
jgi:hypothetical protein